MTPMRTRTTRSLALLFLLFVVLGVAVGAAAPRGPHADAGAADENVLALNDGGQFVFWNLGPAQASEAFTTVVIAWLFNTTAINWTSFIPVLGTVDFALADGDVLWVVSDGPQEIAVGGAPDEPATVMADDGNAELSIPPGALPPGVAASDISVRDLTADPEFAVTEGDVLAAYQLEPFGLTFDKPVTLSFTAEVPDGAVLVAFQQGAESVELLDGLTIDPDPEGGPATVSVVLEHFSGVFDPDGGPATAGGGSEPFVFGFTLDIDFDGRGLILDPPVLAGPTEVDSPVPFTVSVTARVTDVNFITEHSGGGNRYTRLIESRDGPWIISGSFSVLEGPVILSGLSNVDTRVEVGADQPFTAVQEFFCTDVGDFTIKFKGEAKLPVKWSAIVAIGEESSEVREESDEGSGTTFSTVTVSGVCTAPVPAEEDNVLPSFVLDGPALRALYEAVVGPQPDIERYLLGQSTAGPEFPDAPPLQHYLESTNVVEQEVINSGQTPLVTTFGAFGAQYVIAPEGQAALDARVAHDMAAGNADSSLFVLVTTIDNIVIVETVHQTAESVPETVLQTAGSVPFRSRTALWVDGNLLLGTWVAWFGEEGAFDDLAEALQHAQEALAPSGGQ